MGNSALSGNLNGGLSWSKVASGLLIALFAVMAWVWNAHVGDFRDFRKETQTNFRELQKSIESIKAPARFPWPMP